MKNARLAVCLKPDMMAELSARAEREQRTKSLIAEAAIAAYLACGEADRDDGAVTRRLDRLTRQGERLERDLWIAVETLALFIRFYLTMTPPLPEAAQVAAQAKGRERFASFLETLGRQLAKGRSALREVSADDAGGANARAENSSSRSPTSAEGDQP